MLARYINLHGARERRAWLESQVQALPADQWRLQRFEAIHSSAQTCLNLPGGINPAEKACLLSHRALLQEMLYNGADTPFMVWEDDVQIGRRTHEAVSSFLAHADPASWDILYTDLVIPDLQSMLHLLMRGRQLRARREIEILDLSQMSFAGTTAYLVNPLALPNLVGLLNDGLSFDQPVDLLLRRLIHEGRLKGRALFPFATTVSAHSLSSQIQTSSTETTDLAWTLFRQLTWMECDIEALYPLCNRLSSAHPDPESSVMGVITAALVSPQFKVK